MKFICQQKDILEGINIVQKAIPSRTTLPILEGIYISTLQDVIKMTGTDLSLGLGIETHVECKILEEGSVVIPARIFSDVIRKLPDAEVEITVMDNFRVKIQCYNSKITIQGLSSDEYPELERVEEENPIEIEQELFRNMIQQTVFSVAMEETRPIYTGALLEVENGNITIVCLDGYRLAIRKGKISGSHFEKKAIIPGKSLSEISRIIGDPEQKLSITISDKHALFDLGYTRVVSNLLTGDFINYNQIIPEDYNTRIKLDTKILQNSIERAMLVAKEGRNNLIKFIIREGKMIITSNSELGEVYEEIPILLEGKEIDIAFNGRYAIDALKAIEDQEICMDFTTNVNPCVIRPLDGNNYTYLLLPVRLYN